MPSNAPGSIIKIDQLHQNLQQICSDMIKDLESELQSTEMPVNIDKEWLWYRFSPNLQSAYHVVSDNAQTANQEIDNANTKLLGGLGDLRRLPREIRESVYAELISTGSVAITAVSKIINMEAADMVSKLGVFRTKVGYGDNRTVYHPTAMDALYKSKISRVQNVEIRVWSSPDRVRHNELTLGEFDRTLNIVRLTSMRKRCRVEFEFNWLYCRGIVDYLGNLKDLKRFTGFEEVVVVLTRDLQNVMKRLLEYQRADLLRDYTRAMELVEAKLVPAFGDAVWRDEERGMAAYFHPQVM